MKYNLLYKEAIKNIESGKTEKILEGIKVLRESGVPETVNNIADLLLETDNPEIKKNCCSFLNDLKDQKAVPHLVSIIKNKNYESIKQNLVTACWQCNLEFKDYINEFTDLAINSDYITAYEALTVIENNITSISEEESKSSINKIKETILKQKDDKTAMLKELILIIENIPIN